MSFRIDYRLVLTRFEKPLSLKRLRERSAAKTGGLTDKLRYRREKGNWGFRWIGRVGDGQRKGFEGKRGVELEFVGLLESCRFGTLGVFLNSARDFLIVEVPSVAAIRNIPGN